MLLKAPELLQEHEHLSALLAAAIREAGMTRAAIATTKRDAWCGTTHLNVTERREEVSASVADLVAELANCDAEVDALRVEVEAVAVKLRSWGV